jgi:hypothetical protein
MRGARQFEASFKPLPELEKSQLAQFVLRAQMFGQPSANERRKYIPQNLSIWSRRLCTYPEL